MTDISHSPNTLWTAVHTKPRCEKVVEEYCRAHDIAHYLPLRRRAKRYQRRTVVTHLPMFAGYIFVQLDEDRKTTLLRSNKIVHVLGIDAVREVKLIAELNEIKRLENLAIETELVVMPELVAGHPVLIKAGPLHGVRGIIERRSLNQARIVVNVDLLGQAVSVTLDIGEVDPELI